MSNALSIQQDFPDRGLLQVNLTSILGSRAIAGATIQISDNSEPDKIIEEVTSDVNGQTEEITLPTPPLEYSLNPVVQQPYSVFNIQISAPGYESVEISGAEILSGQTSLQNIAMYPMDDALGSSAELYVIPPHTLYGTYPPKIEEAEIKDINETGEIVLSRVVIPFAVRFILFVFLSSTHPSNNRGIPFFYLTGNSFYPSCLKIDTGRMDSLFP